MATVRASLTVAVVAGHILWIWANHAPRGSPTIGLGELLPAVRAGSAVIIDGRDLGDYRSGHIPGAAHHASMPPVGGREVVVYCANAGCNSSSRVAEQASAAGAASVRIYREGFSEWTAGGLPIEAER